MSIEDEFLGDGGGAGERGGEGLAVVSFLPTVV